MMVGVLLGAFVFSRHGWLGAFSASTAILLLNLTEYFWDVDLDAWAAELIMVLNG